METRLDSYEALRQRVMELVAGAQHSLCMFDPTLADMQLGRSAMEPLWQAFLQREDSELRLVVHDTSTLLRDAPRLLRLMQHYSHKIHIHKTLPEAQNATDGILIADGIHMLRRYNINYPRATFYWDEPAAITPWAGRFEEIWQASEAAVSFTTLGL